MTAPSDNSATTTSATVLAPRAIVKLPAIGQRSVRTLKESRMGAAMPEPRRDDKGYALPCHPGRPRPPISGLPEIGIVKCTSRLQPTCVAGGEPGPMKYRL